MTELRNVLNFYVNLGGGLTECIILEATET